jgi:membrane fusion protein (multidrug efflux system)
MSALSRHFANFLVLPLLTGLIPQLAAAQGQGEMPPPAVTVVTLHAEDVPLTTTLPGRVAASAEAEVRPQVNGIVTERLFEEGRHVTVGEPLFRIDPPPMRPPWRRPRPPWRRPGPGRERPARGRAGRRPARPPRRQRKLDRQRHRRPRCRRSRRQGRRGAAAHRPDRTGAHHHPRRAGRRDRPDPGQPGRAGHRQPGLAAGGDPHAGPGLCGRDPIGGRGHPLPPPDGRNRLAGAQAIRRSRCGWPMAPISTQRHADRRRALCERDHRRGHAAPVLRQSRQRILLPGMYVQAVVQQTDRPDVILAPQEGVARDRRGQPIAWWSMPRTSSNSAS